MGVILITCNNSPLRLRPRCQFVARSVRGPGDYYVYLNGLIVVQLYTSYCLMQWPLQSLCLRVESISVVHLVGLDARFDMCLCMCIYAVHLYCIPLSAAKHVCFTAQVFESYSEEKIQLSSGGSGSCVT